MLIFSKELLNSADDLHGVKEYTIPGVYTFTLSRRTRAKITMVGSGQDRHYTKVKNIMSSGTTTTWYAGDGGGVFIGGVVLPSGRYTLTLNQSIAYEYTTSEGLKSTYPSSAAVILANNVSSGNLISIDRTVNRSANLEIIYGTVEMESGGAMSTRDGSAYSYPGVYGGVSLWNGYGKGSDRSASNATTGYFKIEW